MIVLYGTISPSKLRFGISNINDPPDEALDNWHLKRCREIISRIHEDCAFAERVRTLKVYAYRDNDLAPQMSQSRLLVLLPNWHPNSC